MLSKDKMIPGSKIKARPVLKNGLGGIEGLNAEIDYLTLQRAPGESIFYPHHGIPPLAEMEVVHGPKKKNGINVAKVRVDDTNGQPIEGYVYWCELRVSCDHI